MDNQELNDLRERWRIVITQTCNVIGCKDCDLKWDGSCSSNELQKKIIVIEMKDYE
jgi:hypothetical protein